MNDLMRASGKPLRDDILIFAGGPQAYRCPHQIKGGQG